MNGPSQSGEAALVLASASPRRRALLERAGVPFELQPADLDERMRDGESPRESVARLAREKALAVAARLPAGSRRLVLGADTGVVIDGELLGKPRDPAHAVALLSRLAGRTHRVITAVAIAGTASGRVHECAVESQVRLRAASRAEIEAYVAGGEPMDKAGAYAIQGDGRRFVEAVQGSETNVIGLPLEETLELLAQARRDAASE